MRPCRRPDAPVLVDADTQRFFLLDAYASEARLTPETRARYDRELRQPTLIVWGLDAETTPVEDAEAFLRARPTTQFLPLDGAKLLPNEDRAAAFDAALVGFLGRLEPRDE